MAKDDGPKACEYLPWDSEFFGCRIGRARCAPSSESAISAIERWCAEHRIDCLYLLNRADDAVAIRMAESHGFERVDTRVVMAVETSVARDIAPSEAEGSVRPWAEGDLQTLERIAASSHRGTRFYADRHFSRSRCDALYIAWIENSCRGWADSVLVGELDGQVAGYVTCHLDGDWTGRLGLVAVAEFARGRGMGRQLVARALERFSDRDARRVIVATQGRNIEAQRLYSRGGFRIQSIQAWHHRWFGVRSLTP